MPRKRINTADNWMPDRVYREGSSYVYRPKGAKSQSLCLLMRDDAGNVIEPPEKKKEVLDAYAKAIAGPVTKNIDYWLTQFLISPRYTKLGNWTQRDYRRYIEIQAKPDEPGSRDGIRYVFGQMQPTKVKTRHIRDYMDYWATAGKESTANKHLACLQTFFGWLRQKVDDVDNPAHGVTKFKEKARKVYIDDEAYFKVLDTAAKSATPIIAAVMEIAYLCGLRKHEVLRLNIEDVDFDNRRILIVRGKGSNGEYTEFSERLEQAINVAMALNRPQVEPLKNRPLLRSNKKTRLSRSALDKAWRKIRADAGVPDFWIHDLKKKAGSEGKDLGHKTQAMKDLYDLLPKVKQATK